jgi:hypothetical protein
VRIARGLAILVALSVPLSLVGLLGSWAWEGKPDRPESILDWLQLVGFLDVAGLVTLSLLFGLVAGSYTILYFLYQLGGTLTKDKSN